MIFGSMGAVIEEFVVKFHFYSRTHIDDAPRVLSAADLLAGLGLDDGVGADDGEGDALLQPRVLPPLVLLRLSLLSKGMIN